MPTLNTTHRTPIAFLIFLMTVSACLAFASSAQAEDPKPAPAAEADGDRFKKIMVADFEGPIGTMTWVYMQRVIKRAEDEGFDCLVLRIDSPGGTVFHSELIADRLFGLTDIHTLAWVPVRAISGACMVAMGCDEIVMKDSGTIGDCQPIFMQADGYTEAGEKLESPLRAVFRKYAERHGYPIPLAEAFVSKNLHVIEVESRTDGQRYFIEQTGYESAEGDDIVTDGRMKSDLRRIGRPVVTDEQLLTLTARETHRFGFQRREFGDALFPTDEAALLDVLKAPGATVTMETLTFFERASAFLLGLAGILAAVATLAAALTIYKGTISTMSIIGGCALVLLILINVTADQLYGFPLFLIAVGALLLAAEAFIIPGFGVAGVLGIVSFASGFFFLATGTTLGETDGRLPDGALQAFGLQFIIGIIACFATMLALSRFLPSMGPGRRMILSAPSGGAVLETPAPAHIPSIGDVGYTQSPLRPAGTAEFAGELVDVVSEGGFLDPGLRVRVLAIEGNQITVGPDAQSGETA